LVAHGPRATQVIAFLIALLPRGLAAHAAVRGVFAGNGAAADTANIGPRLIGVAA